MKKRDYALVKDGKYNMTAIMQKAWAYKNDLFCTLYRKNFRGALKAAWSDAIVEMDSYKHSLIRKPIEKEGNVLRSFFLCGRHDLKHYDSSWQ